MVLRKFGMLPMLSTLYVNNNPERPAIYVTVTVCGRTEYLQPTHIDAELSFTRPQQQTVCIKVCKRNHKPHL